MLRKKEIRPKYIQKKNGQIVWNQPPLQGKNSTNSIPIYPAEGRVGVIDTVLGIVLGPSTKICMWMFMCVVVPSIICHSTTPLRVGNYCRRSNRGHIEEESQHKSGVFFLLFLHFPLQCAVLVP